MPTQQNSFHFNPLSPCPPRPATHQRDRFVSLVAPSTARKFVYFYSPATTPRARRASFSHPFTNVINTPRQTWCAAHNHSHSNTKPFFPFCIGPDFPSTPQANPHLPTYGLAPLSSSTCYTQINRIASPIPPTILQLAAPRIHQPSRKSTDSLSAAMSPNVLTEKSTNTPIVAKTDSATKEVKSMEYHRQVLQDKMAQEK